MKGGTGGGTQTNSCKTLPNSSNSPGMGGIAHHMQTGNPAGDAAALKHPGSRGSGILGDASTAGEAISSAIVKYNYQAQQVGILLNSHLHSAFIESSMFTRIICT